MLIERIPIDILTEKLIEGPIAKARCVECKNNTRGEKCEECNYGHFRGTEELRDVCRP